MMQVDLNLGDTRLIISEAADLGILRNQVAYLLATAYWETARTMEPVTEAYYLQDKYGWTDERMDRWRKENLRYYPWHGRGYVQLTWEDNYRRASDAIGADLIARPDDATLPMFAAEILILGCMEGWFTGHAIGDYITLRGSDFIGARRVVNGQDRAHEIAAIAKEYDAALKAEGYGEKPTVTPKPSLSPLVAFFAMLASIFKRKEQ